VPLGVAHLVEAVGLPPPSRENLVLELDGSKDMVKGLSLRMLKVFQGLSG